MFRAPPSGTVDRLFQAADVLRQVEDTTLGCLQKAGYSEVILPLIEHAEVFASEGAVRFVDRHGELMALRADFTGQVARVVATRLKAQEQVKLCYRGAVFRDVEARSGQRRQLHQAGFEHFDSGRVDSDVEAIRLALAVADAHGLQDVRVTLGSAALIHALCPQATPADRSALDRRDASMLPASLLPLLEFTGNVTVLDDAAKVLPSQAHPALQRLQQVYSALGDDARRTIVDLAEVRPWEYYTGIVFDVFARGMRGPVAAGGRYDALSERYGAPRPAIGAFIDIDALTAHRLAPVVGESSNVLTVALPKGRIKKGVLEALGKLAPSDADLDSRKLRMSGQVAFDASGPLSFLLVKDADIPAYVERGVADVGVVGLDVLDEGSANVLVPLATSLGRCRMCLCGKPGTNAHALAAGGNLRVATKYPRIAGRALEAKAIPAEIIPLQGSVELAVVTGLTDLIVDMVETGETLRANGLEVLEDLMVSTARVIVNRGAWRQKHASVRELLTRLGTSKGADVA